MLCVAPAECVLADHICMLSLHTLEGQLVLGGAIIWLRAVHWIDRHDAVKPDADWSAVQRCTG